MKERYDFDQFACLLYVDLDNKIDDLDKLFATTLQTMSQDQARKVRDFTSNALASNATDTELREIWRDASSGVGFSDGHWRVVFEIIRDQAAKRALSE